jgi:hypothetical protein
MVILLLVAALAASAAAAIPSAGRTEPKSRKTESVPVAGRTEPRSRRLDSVPVDPVGDFTGKFKNLEPSSLGPAAPEFAADVTVDPAMSIFAASPAALESTLVPPAVRLIESAGCSIGAAVPSCAGNLSICLSADISNTAGACACYTKFAKCFDSAGCIEWLPSTDVHYCRYTLYCTRGECELSGAFSNFVSAAAFFALAVSVILAAAGG